MLIRNDGKRWKAQFDNLPQLIGWMKETPRVWSSKESQSVGHGASWDLGASYERSLELAREGWPEGVKQLHALASHVPNATLATRSYSVAGDFPDVPRCVAGDPFNMVKRGREQKPKPTMTIAVNTRVSCAVGAKEAANFGAAIVALVDRLENRGVRVELVGLFATNRGTWGAKGPSPLKRWSVSWTVKKSEDHLDLSAVAFSFAHPAMFRRLGFGVMERSPKEMQDSGYGIDGGITEDDFFDIAPGALLIKGVDHNPGACRTMEGALAFAKANINEAAIKLGGEPIVELEV